MALKVSVIVPVYNVREYISECLESIISQTLKEIEIVCIDDGSTDGSEKILDEYALRDERVKVIHKSNAGYGSAMNTGMDIATGDYIGIVDGDDSILPEMYEVLYSVAKNADLDLVKSDHFLMYGENLQLVSTPLLNDYYNKVLDKSYRKLYFRFIMNTWTGIYRRKFIKDNNIRHNETAGASYQDNGFWIQTVAMCKKAEWIQKAFYKHRLDNPAASMKSRGKMLAVMKEFEFAGDILKKANLIEEYKICNFYRMSGHKTTFYRIDNSLKKEYAHIIKRDFEEHRKETDWNVEQGRDELISWLEILSEDPDKFSDTEIGKGRFAVKMLQEVKHIIIYGTGIRARMVFDTLMKLGMLSKILFVAVTEKDEKSYFFGYDVRSAEEIIPYRDEALVLISVAKRSCVYREIESHLMKLGIQNYSDTESFYAI